MAVLYVGLEFVDSESLSSLTLLFESVPHLVTATYLVRGIKLLDCLMKKGDFVVQSSSLEGTGTLLWVLSFNLKRCLLCVLGVSFSGESLCWTVTNSSVPDSSVR